MLFVRSKKNATENVAKNEVNRLQVVGAILLLIGAVVAIVVNLPVFAKYSKNGNADAIVVETLVTDTTTTIATTTTAVTTTSSSTSTTTIATTMATMTTSDTVIATTTETTTVTSTTPAATTTTEMTTVTETVAFEDAPEDAPIPVEEIYGVLEEEAYFEISELDYAEDVFEEDIYVDEEYVDTVVSNPWGIEADSLEYIQLCNAVAYEAGSSWIPTSEKAMVAEVIMNRLDAGYADTVYGVLTQRGQFSGVWNYIDMTWYSNRVTDDVKIAVDGFLDGTYGNHGYYSFYGDGKRNHFR